MAGSSAAAAARRRPSGGTSSSGTTSSSATTTATATTTTTSSGATAAATATDAAAAKRFEDEVTSRGAAGADAVFFAAHLVMSGLQRRYLVTSREQAGFRLAMAIFAGALATQLLCRRRYRQWRPRIVFAVHVACTAIRAWMVHSMANKQATHWKADTRFFFDADSATTLGFTILAVLGGPFRIFEAVGLQQPFLSHALISLWYLLVHSAAVANGCRLAYTNSLFFQHHRLYDELSALLDAAGEALAGLPASGGPQTCCACPGVVLYVTGLLFGSVLAPLTVLRQLEAAARRRFRKRLAAAEAAAAAGAMPARVAARAPASAAGAGAAATVVSPELDEQQQPLLQPHQPPPQQPPPQHDLQAALDAVAARADEPLRVGALLGADGLAASAAGVRLVTNVLLLLAQLLGCWLFANFVALSVLPRVMAPEQLAKWCPNRPLVPFLIAGDTHPSVIL